MNCYEIYHFKVKFVNRIVNRKLNMKKLIFFLSLTLSQFVFSQKIHLELKHSADFLYRNIQNEFRVYAEPQDSIGPISVSSNIWGLSRGEIDGLFYMEPTTEDHKLRLTASAKKKDGKTISKAFDLPIKELPAVQSFVYDKQTLKLNKSQLNPIKIHAFIPDFPYEIDFEVVSFEVILPNSKAFKVDGNTLDSKVQKKINNLKSGSRITISNIWTLAGENYHGKEKHFASSNDIVIEISN